MDNSQYKLLKINGEYVKFYVTTNTALPQLLKNSGSLVILHSEYRNQDKQNKLITYNSAWLGGQLIAGGWGFHSQEELDNGRWWANSYQPILKELKDADTANKQYTYNTAYNYLLPKIDNFVVRSDGTLAMIDEPKADVSNNFIFPNDYITRNQGIRLKDIFKFLVAAEYEQPELLDYDVSIEYQSYFEQHFGITTLYTSSINKENNTINLPVDALIKQIDFYYKFKNNDIGGVNSFNFTTNGDFIYNTTSPDNTTNDDIKINNDGVTRKFQEISDEDSEYSEFYIYHTYPNNYKISIDKELLNNPKVYLQDTFMAMKGTPSSKYKVYPLLQDSAEYKNIKSAEKCLQDFNYIFDDVKVEGKYYTIFLQNTLDTAYDITNGAPIETLSNMTFYPISTGDILVDLATKYPMTRLLDTDNIVNYEHTRIDKENTLLLFTPSNHPIKEIRLYKDGSTKDYDNITGLFINVNYGNYYFHDSIPYDMYCLLLTNDNDFNGTIQVEYYDVYNDDLSYKKLKTSVSNEPGKLMTSTISKLDNTLTNRLQFLSMEQFELIGNSPYEITHWLGDDFDVTNLKTYIMLDNFIENINQTK